MTQYFYRTMEPIRVAVDKLRPRKSGNSNGYINTRTEAIPFGLDKEELITYAYEEFGVVLSRKRGIDSLVTEIYRLGSASHV